MAHSFRHPFFLLLLAGLALLTGCDGCNKPHQTVTPETLERLRLDDSLTDLEAIKQFGAAVFRSEFGDKIDAKRNKQGGYTAYVWIKQWHHKDFPEDMTFLLNPVLADTETVRIMQTIKADLYRMVALRMDEYVEEMESRPLDSIVVRIGRNFREQGVEFNLLQVEVKKEDFPKLHEALGDNRTRLYNADDEDVITTMDAIWEVSADGFPKPAP